MTETFIELYEDDFDARYSLVPNHINPDASWATGEGGGCLFETYGDELEFVRRQAPGTIWTLLDGDDGDLYLVSGYHFVNRTGYPITTVAVPEGTDIEVHIPMERENEAEPDDEILDSLFHGCALAAFLDEAAERQGWPDSVAVRQRAYRYYEDALAEKHRRKSASLAAPVP